MTAAVELPARPARTCPHPADRVQPYSPTLSVCLDCKQPIVAVVR